MRKLQLESLQVESFETTAVPSRMRGTVQGNAAVPGTTIAPGTGVSDCMVCQPWSNDYNCVPLTYDAHNCGETNYMDCTYGCTRACSDPRNSCGNVCYADPDYTLRCVRE